MRTIRIATLIAAVLVVSFLHYQTTTTQVWLHQLFQRAYYIPIILTALWYGWRGGLFAAGFSALLYVPHILMSWTSHPEYRVDQFIEILMFFAIGSITGVLSDHERAHRRKVEETARQLGEVYAQLQRSFEQLRRADRLSALGELSAGLAHEIRNPLGSIEGAVNLLLESVVKLALETASMADVNFRIETSEELPSVLIDQEQIKQVLVNLVINAVQAMPAGGQIALRAVQGAENIRIEIQDEGTGIPLEDLERVFDPFFTTRSQGTGLGLSIAYQIVTQHGGHITAKQNPERGMTFAVTLPAVSAASEAVTPRI